MNKIPPAPPGWKKTISDLLAEAQRGERAAVGSPEVDWARDYERSRVASGVRFPRKGDVYEAKTDILVRYLTAWAVPYTGGGDGSLKCGDRVLIHQLPAYAEPITVYAKPVDYAHVEQRMVPADIRANPNYSGFYLSLKTVDLHSHFKLLPGEEP
jgi:hypothetical protein